MPSFFFHISIDLEQPPVHKSLFLSDDSNQKPRSARLLTNSTLPQGKAQIVPSTVKNGSGAESARRHIQTLDWRYGNVALQYLDMNHTTNKKEEANTERSANGHLSSGIGAGPSGLATKGRYEPTAFEEEDLGWGIVRLYRDAEETPGLYEESLNRHTKHRRGLSTRNGFDQGALLHDEDCTTLCILAVPSYLTPSDFLGFVGEKTRDEVRHFRMIRTERVNRYMVLMRFRSGKRAREWRKEWNGKVFNSMEVRLSLLGIHKHS